MLHNSDLIFHEPILPIHFTYGRIKKHFSLHISELLRHLFEKANLISPSVLDAGVNKNVYILLWICVTYLKFNGYLSHNRFWHPILLYHDPVTLEESFARQQSTCRKTLHGLNVDRAFTLRSLKYKTMHYKDVTNLSRSSRSTVLFDRCNNITFTWWTNAYFTLFPRNFHF